MTSIAFLFVMAIIGSDGREDWSVLDSGLSAEDCAATISSMPATVASLPNGVTVVFACEIDGLDA